MSTTSEASPLITFAEEELDRAKLGDPDSDYGGMLKPAVLDLVRAFSDQGHSGFSAAMTVSIVEKLMRFEPLTPLTGDDDEWNALNYDEHMKAQNRRCSHVFQRADGTAYDSEGRIFREPNGVCFTGRGSRVDITFPYVPAREYVDVTGDDRECPACRCPLSPLPNGGLRCAAACGYRTDDTTWSPSELTEDTPDPEDPDEVIPAGVFLTCRGDDPEDVRAVLRVEHAVAEDGAEVSRPFAARLAAVLNDHAITPTDERTS